MTNFEQAQRAWMNIASVSLAFGEFARKAVEEEGRTIRELSIALCGNEALEDRIARYIQAAKWDLLIHLHPVYRALYEDMRDWLTVSHFTELWRMYVAAEDKQDVFDLFEQLFIRDRIRNVTEARPVDWLRSKRMPERSTAEIFHRFWKMASNALPEAYSELERRGLQASKADRRRVRVLEMAVKMFSAEQVTETEAG